MKPSTRPHEGAVPTPRELYEWLDQYVIGQERAKKAVSVAASTPFKRVSARRDRVRSPLKKSNVLMIGPTGCGKTHIARHLAEALRVPFVIVDATEYTEAGYYGKDVEVMVAELLLKANHSVEETQRGIVFIDEVDKIARRSHGARTGAGARDIGGEGVQQALLKLLEGREIFVPLNVTQHWNKHDFVQVDTSDILFICAGTFTDLFDDPARGARRIRGFHEALDGAAPPKEKRRRLTHRDLLEYGMLGEFLGRLPIVVELEPLARDDLTRILVEPPDSLVREYREMLAMDGITLAIEPDALGAIADHALKSGYGARGLRGTLEEIMRDVMFDAPTRQEPVLHLTEPWVKERLAALG